MLYICDDNIFSNFQLKKSPRSHWHFPFIVLDYVVQGGEMKMTLGDFLEEVGDQVLGLTRRNQ